jgi:carbon monoxide dehydrogenase subunit G
VIEIENDFSVPAHPDVVYDYLLQLEEVGQCIPGGRVGPAGDDGAHPAEVVVKLGPMRFNYRGTVRLEDRVEAERKATLTANMREARGQGSAKARMEMTVEGEENGARVRTGTEVELTGRAASMGRGVIDDVAGRMVEEMAECMTRRLGSQGTPTAPTASTPTESAAPTEPAAPAPVGGLRLIARVLWARLTRLFKRR